MFKKKAKTSTPPQSPAGPPNPAPAHLISALLQTNEPTEQIARLQQMRDLLTQPTLMLTIVLDPRRGAPHISAVSSLGGSIDLATAHYILEEGRKGLIELERQQAQQAASAPPSPQQPEEGGHAV